MMRPRYSALLIATIMFFTLPAVGVRAEHPVGSPSGNSRFPRPRQQLAASRAKISATFNAGTISRIVG